MKKILDNDYYDFIISNSLIPPCNILENITKLNGEYSLIHLGKQNKQACDLGLHPYEDFPAVFTLTSTICTDNPGHLSPDELPVFNYMGLGVVIGLIDTGIDYSHPVFQNHDRSTRILSIWDQTDQTGKPPEGFEFGSEYTKNHINTALQSPLPMNIVPESDTNGHGTAIASIIAGGRDEKHSFTGIVPQSKLAVVKLKEAKNNLKQIYFIPEHALCYQESDIMLGIRYLLGVAEQLNRPLIICICLGSSQGGHDGCGPLNSYLDQIVRRPRVGVVTAAGNEAEKKRHYYAYSYTPPFGNEFDLRIGNDDRMFSMEIWPFPAGRITIELYSPDCEIVSSPFTSINTCQKFSLACGQSTIWINNIFLEGSTGDQVILVRFDNPCPGIWHCQVKSEGNEPFSYHCWLPSGNLISPNTYFYQSDPNTTIASPGDARVPLTIAAYNQLNNQILGESGRGFTRFGEIIPDVAAPGYKIPCALPDNRFGTFTGTGAAAAHAAGVAAMIMEWGFIRGNHTSITGVKANRMIIRWANRDNAYFYPNNIWGYGSIDMYHLFKQIEAFT
ncbi:S8 family peptidase [Clostridium boliviensis]|uniref:S8 family peptidase n=1 Tax=Clostridium boliviensis TaxID=318465 RepID=A0ABU4GSG8_9CLOT|nr:S8 family peptidase [Clostridium boliviensis]MDW2800551.1 S8 family peptidase [Clostridium boliviensis]